MLLKPRNLNVPTVSVPIQMPVLSPHLLSDHRELRLAHLALGFISMGYVWQEGQHSPAQVQHCKAKVEVMPFNLYICTSV